MPGSPPLTLEEILGPGGALSRVIHCFETRPAQFELASAAARLFDAGGALLAEVGTGSGKTLGYLVPALMAGRQTIVSTGTRNLQEQIYHKDFPLLREIWPAVRGAYLKGRNNYLCRMRLAGIFERPFLPGSAEAAFAGRVLAWAAASDTGDRAELPWLGDDDPLWSWVSAEHEACLGSRCPHLSGCFVARARRRAAAADLVVLNHHLLLAEAASGDQTGLSLLPEAELLVVDEAHLLEEVATRQLGMEVSTGALGKLFRETAAVLDAVKGKPGRRWMRRGFELLEALAAALPPGDGAFPQAADPADGPRPALRALAGHLEEMRSRLELMLEKESAPEQEYLERRARRLAESLAFIAAAREPDFIYWHERRGSLASCYASPADVSGDLPRLLFGRFHATLLTSATLAIGGHFRYLKERLGLEGAAELVAGSPFDYRRQAVLYLPERMPDPNSAEYPEAVAREIIRLLPLTGGRAFVLCTSRRNLDLIHARLLADTPYRVLRQGDAPKSALLAGFMERPSVLVATTSFWQGVDVPGEALSAVIIDRLPFASPDDPVTGGRIGRIRDKGGEPFRDYQLPAAVIMLKQGLGRLIRRRTDRGLLAVMDPRLRSKSYGRVFLASLPPMRVVGDLDSLKEAYRDLQTTDDA